MKKQLIAFLLLFQCLPLLGQSISGSYDGDAGVTNISYSIPEGDSLTIRFGSGSTNGFSRKLENSGMLTLSGDRLVAGKGREENTFQDPLTLFGPGAIDITYKRHDCPHDQKFTFDHDSVLSYATFSNQRQYVPAVSISKFREILNSILSSQRFANCQGGYLSPDEIPPSPAELPLVPQTPEQREQEGDSLWRDQLGTLFAQGVDALDQLIEDPVDAVSGAFLVDEVDLSVPSAIPLVARRNYSSVNEGRSSYGYGWKEGFVPYLQRQRYQRASDGSIVESFLAAELDGTVIEYSQTSSNSNIYVADAGGILGARTNPHISSHTQAGAFGAAILQKQHIERMEEDPAAPMYGDSLNGKTRYKYVIKSIDGSKRYYQTRRYSRARTGIFYSLGIGGLVYERPFLYLWEDENGNYLTFDYEETKTSNNYGELVRIRSSNGLFLRYEYHDNGTISKISDREEDDPKAREVQYSYNSHNDLTQVTRPDGTTVNYTYGRHPGIVVGVGDVSNHLLLTITKPDNRKILNVYDVNRRKVTAQYAETAPGELSRTASFVYGVGSRAEVIHSVPSGNFRARVPSSLTITFTHNQPAHDNQRVVSIPFASFDSRVGSNSSISAISEIRAEPDVSKLREGGNGWTRVYDYRNKPSDTPANDTPGNVTFDQSNPAELGSNCQLTEYANGRITKKVDTAGQEVTQMWSTHRLSSQIDQRGLTTTFAYDGDGNLIRKTVEGDLTGNGDQTETFDYHADYNPNRTINFSRKLKGQTPTSSLYDYTFFTYGDSAHPRLPTEITQCLSASASLTAPDTSSIVSRVVTVYEDRGGDSAYTGALNAAPAFTNGLNVSRRTYHSDGKVSTIATDYNDQGYVVKSVKFGETSDSGALAAVPNSADDEGYLYFYDFRGEQQWSIDRSGARKKTSYDPRGRISKTEIYSGPVPDWSATEPIDPMEGATLLSTIVSNFNSNEEIGSVDGPRPGDEDLTSYVYDYAGRLKTVTSNRSQANELKTDLVPSQASVTENEYNLVGNLVKTTDPRGNETVVKYDESGRVLSSTSYDGAEGGKVLAHMRYDYAAALDKQKSFNALGQVTSYQYNARGQVIQVDTPDGLTSKTGYFLDGRIASQGSYSGTTEISRVDTTYQDLYVEEGKIYTRVTQEYFSAGSSVASSVSLIDSRGNTVSTTDHDNYTNLAEYDGMGRSLSGTGPEGLLGHSVQQVVSTSYDLVAREVEVTNSLNEVTRITGDALGRNVLSEVLSDDGTVLRTVSKNYADDFRSVTTITGDAGSTETFPTKVTVFTDSQGLPVISQKHRSATEIDSSAMAYDVSGNLISASDELGQTTVMTYDGLNRIQLVVHPDKGQELTGYDILGNVTDRHLPRGLHWTAGYDPIGRMEFEKLQGRDGAITRHFSYSYHRDGQYTGLVSAKIDQLRGTTTQTTNYDTYYRPKTVVYSSSFPDLIGVTKSFTYDNRGNLKSCTETHQGFDNSEVVIARAYDGYSQLVTETTSVDGSVHHSTSLKWDTAGRRTDLDSTAEAQLFEYDYGYDADGRISSSTLKHGTTVAASSFNFTESGLLASISSPWCQTTFATRDGRGRKQRVTHGLLSQGGDGSAVSTYAERMYYRDDSLLSGREFRLSSYGISGNTGESAVSITSAPPAVTSATYPLPPATVTDLAYTDIYSYDAKNRLLDYQRFNRRDIAGLSSESRNYGFDSSGLGLLENEVITIHAVGEPAVTAKTSSWLADEFSRNRHKLETGSVVLPASGVLNLPAQVTLILVDQETSDRYEISDVTVTPREGVAYTYDWAAAINVPAGTYRLTAMAETAFGLQTSAEKIFTKQSSDETLTQSTYDDAGFLKSRTWPNGREQAYVWDVLGRLLGVTDNSPAGFSRWKARYDGDGRRISWSHQGQLPAGQGEGDLELDVKCYFDPLIEFLELGTSWSGRLNGGEPFTQSPIYRLIGPGVGGSYAGHNGIGAILGYLGDGIYEGALTDTLGDIVGTIDGSGQLVSAELSAPYGPDSTQKFLPTSDQLSLNLLGRWKSRSLDPTGLICMGTRYYDPESARFISPDPLGHSATLDLYMYAGGDPINYLDSDGRLAKKSGELAGDVKHSAIGYYRRQLMGKIQAAMIVNELFEGFMSQESGPLYGNGPSAETLFTGSDQDIIDSLRYDSEPRSARRAGEVIRDALTLRAVTGNGNGFRAPSGSNWGSNLVPATGPGSVARPVASPRPAIPNTIFDKNSNAPKTAAGNIKFKRWSRGDAIDKPLPDGSAPSWGTVQSRYWKNRYQASRNSGEFSQANLERMRRGSAAQDYNPRTGNLESRTLHHVDPQRAGGSNSPINLRELKPDWHSQVDPFYHVPGVPTSRGIR